MTEPHPVVPHNDDELRGKVEQILICLRELPAHYTSNPDHVFVGAFTQPLAWQARRAINLPILFKKAKKDVVIPVTVIMGRH